MFVYLKGILHTVLLPPCGTLILALVGAVLVARRRGGGWLLLWTGLLSLCALSTPYVADVLSRIAERCPPLDYRQVSRAQAIVILGGDGGRFTAPEYGGAPAAENALLQRLDYGAFLARKSALPVLLTSDPENTAVMAASLSRDFGVTARWLDIRSGDTFQNASNSAAMLRTAGVHTILLVTSSTHMLRSTREFEATGLAVIPAPAGVWSRREAGVFLFIPQSDALSRSQTALCELLGELVREVLAALHLRRHSG